MYPKFFKENARKISNTGPSITTKSKENWGRHWRQTALGSHVSSGFRMSFVSSQSDSLRGQELSIKSQLIIKMIYYIRTY